MSIEKKHKNLYNIGVSYKKANALMRGSFSLSKNNQIALLNEAKEKGIEGLLVLSTCNRTEITGLVEHPFNLISLLCKFSNGSVEDFVKVSNVYKNQDAIQHLFRIGTGLESQILGDYEIVGQLRQSFKLAKKVGTINTYFERLLNNIMQASKKVKNETKLSSGTTSVSYVAIQYIINHLSEYNTKNILVYGLGKIGKHTCKNLVKYTQNKQVTLINRTEKKVTAFVKEHPFIKKATHIDLSLEIAKADVLIVSTGADKPTITSSHISKEKKLLILDLSIPANVDKNVKNLKNITVINVDELSKVTDKTLAMRQQEIPLAEKIIKKNKVEFYEWLNHRRFTPAINTLKKSLEIIQKNELAFHKKKIKNFNEEQATVITSRFIQKIITQFVKHLKNENTSIPQSIHIMNRIFETEIEE